MNTFTLINDLPKRIGDYDFITRNIINIECEKDDFILYFDEVGTGDLKEALVTYDNRFYGYSLRVKGRGEEIALEFGKYKIFSDSVGPIAAENVKTEIRPLTNLVKDLKDFMLWMKDDLTTK
jgi:hypothetical protein